MSWSIDHFYLRLEGAQNLRAFKLPLHTAVALSLAMHAILLSYAFSSHQTEKKRHWGSIEVHLDATQSDMGLTETPAVHADPDIARSNSGQTAHLLASPESPKALAHRQAQPAAHTATAPSAAPATNDTPTTGMTIPQDLPIPFPGRRPLWSIQGPALANAQAAYQAQVQQQQVAASMQNQARMARGQYESYLKNALAALPLKSTCKVILSVDAKPGVYCDNEQDTRQVQTVIERFGRIPAIPGESSPLEISVTPASVKPSNILS